MVELYLEARLHNRISDADYRALLLRQDLDHQEQKLRQTLLQLIDAGSIRLDTAATSAREGRAIPWGSFTPRGKNSAGEK